MSGQGLPLGFAQGTDIPIEHLDYSYIGECSDPKELERIVKILRSGGEGHYPDLTAFAEKRLASLEPRSKVLIKENDAQYSRNLSAKDAKTLEDDMKDWLRDMSEKDKQNSTLKSTPSGATPPVRSQIPANQPDSLASQHGELSSEDIERMANHEKDKGNESFRAGDFEESLEYYTTSLSFHQTVAVLTNRALAYIKLKRYQNAITDCEKALSMEPNNVKALFRKATALEATQRFQEASQVLKALLIVDPSNKKASDLFAKVNNKLETIDGGKPRGKKINIIEHSTTDEKEEFTAPKSVAELKEKGNNFFKIGQYSEAVECYNKALKILDKDYPMSAADGVRSVLLNNRGACWHKLGDCSLCIKDTSRSIQLEVVNIKAYARRAQAYEAMERYAKAYVDYQCALYIDSNFELARNASSRLMRILQDLNGSVWRSKLPTDPLDVLTKHCLSKNSSFHTLNTGSIDSATTIPNSTTALPDTAATPSGTTPAPSGTTPAPSGTTPAPSGTTSAKTSTTPAPSGTTPALSGTTPAPSGTTPAPSGTTPAPSGNTSAKPSTTPALSGTTPAPSGTTPAPSGTPPTPSGTTSAKPSTTSVPSGTTPAPSGTTPAPSGTTPAPSGTTPAPSGTTPAPSGTTPAPSGTTPAPSGTTPAPSGTTPAPSGTTSASSGTTPAPSGTTSASSEPSDHRDDSSSLKNGSGVSYDQLRLEGNSFVKVGNFRKAIDCYSLCIKAKPTEIVPYTNRALCYLKLDENEKAAADCSQALALDNQNVKALYRRALAYKQQKLYKESLKDFINLLKIEDNAIAKKEMELTKELWRKEMNASSSSSSSSAEASQKAKRRKKVKIVEVEDHN